MDLDSQVNNLFLKSHNIVQKTALNWRLSARNAARRDSVLAASRDYRNIIERLQVMWAGSPHPAVLLEPEKGPGGRRGRRCSERSQRPTDRRMTRRGAAGEGRAPHRRGL